jgi:peptide/nickel transport system ATP-binding protein
MSPNPAGSAPSSAANTAVERAVLDVRGLSVSIGRHDLLHDLNFSIRRGERVGLIGESGSGKSLTSLAVLGLLPEGARPTGSVRLAGVSHDIVGASERDMAKVRGNDVSMVFQEPMTALNPTMRVGAQVAETILIHAGRGGRPGAGRGAVRTRVVALLEQVGLPDPAEIARAYPHQLSGGQRQRVVLAIALANDPELLVCDEPTTALDVTVQARVLDLIVQGVEARNAAMLFITHDLAVVATVCERVLVMYGGRIVEAGPVSEVFTRPRHRYTEGLLGASDLEGADPHEPLVTIPGSVPPAGSFPAGCVFRTRCAHATEECATLPPWDGPDPEHGYACFHPAGGVQ